VNDLFLLLRLLSRLLYCLSQFFSSGSLLSTLKVAFTPTSVRASHTLKNHTPVRRRVFFLHLPGSTTYFNSSRKLFLWNTVSRHYHHFCMIFNMWFQCVTEIPWIFFHALQKEKLKTTNGTLSGIYEVPTWERHFFQATWTYDAVTATGLNLLMNSHLPFP